jgi:hypothetical protein
MTNRRRFGPSRCGFLLVEAAAAVVLTAAVLTLAVHALKVLADADRTTRRRSVATAEAAELMERLATQNDVDLAADTPARWTLSCAAQEVLPEGRLSIDIDARSHSALKRVRVEIRWRDDAGAWARPVRLTAWLNSARRLQP